MFFTLNYNIPEWSSGFSSPFFLLQFSTLRNFLKILDPQKSKTWDFFAAKTFEIPNLMKKKFMRNIRTSTQNPKRKNINENAIYMLSLLNAKIIFFLLLQAVNKII